LKKTKSLCPKCFIKINAQIVEKNNKVYMIKECPKHGKFTGVVENDAEFYKRTMDIERKKSMVHSLFITINHNCNLNCNYCALPEKNRENFSFEHLKKVISESNCKEVRLTGGEPTLRDDVLDIICFIKKTKKLVTLVTNGLKLVDFDYVKRLKDAGLDRVCFSFNSFNDDVFKKLNNRKLLKIKLNALGNLKKLDIPTVVSIMIVKGINDRELKKIFDYCVENNSFIKELRIRSSAPFGKYIKSDTFFVSDMIIAFSKILDIEKKEFLKFIGKETSSCTFSIDMISYRQGNFIHPWMLFKKINYRNPINRVIVAFNLLKKFRFKQLFSLVYNELHGKNNLSLRLEFRSWPNKYNIDLKELSKCSTYYLSKSDGEIPCCYAGILNNENIIEL